MKKISKLLLFVTTALLLLTSCKERRHEKLAEIYQKADATYATYNVTEADRVINAYRGRYSINAPQGAEVSFNDLNDASFAMSSPDKKSMVYVYAENVFKYHETDWLADSTWSINSKKFKTLDTRMFNLGELESQKRALLFRHFIRKYNVNDSTDAIVHIYMAGKAGYLLVGYHPKDDDSFVQEAADSFSPAHVVFWWWWYIVIIVALGLIAARCEGRSDGLYTFFLLLLFIVPIIMAVWPYLASWIRGYIPGCVFWNEILTFIIQNA